jgi:hypothetical protein
MPSTERGLILFAGQQSLTHAQVAELPPVAAFRLSKLAPTRRTRVWPPRMGPRMCLTVRSARSFYEWSQRTGPDDPSETNLPVFHRPSESGQMPAGGQVQMGPGNSVLLKSRAKQAARERSAKPSPALRSSKSNPQCTPRAAAVSSPCCGADLQVRVGPPGPARTCPRQRAFRVNSASPAEQP